MASPDRSKRKILKAKKTMPASCRKQVEILNKSKNAEALKTANGNRGSSGNRNSSTGVINSKYGHSENDASLLDSNKNSVCSEKSKAFSQNVMKPLEIVDSEKRLEYIEKQVVRPYQKPSKTESSRKLLTQEAKDSRNTSKNHTGCQTDVRKSYFEQHEEDCTLKSICCPSSILSGMVQIPKTTVSNTLDDKRMDKIVSYLETNSNSESRDKRQGDILILSSDIRFVPVDKISKLLNSVISSTYATDISKSEESCRTCHSSISGCESIDSTRLSALDADSNNGHNQKKRMFSENKQSVKRMKTSEQINENICVALEKQTALLEQVKHLIRQEICSINYKLFDNKLKELTERIGKTQCRNKHEAIADELFAKISKLQRRIKTVLQPQKNCLEPNVLTTNTARKLTNSETENLGKNPESVSSPDEGKTSMSSEPSNPSENASKKVNLSQDHDEPVSESNNDDVMLISVQSPNLTTPITSAPTGSRKTTSRNYHNSNNSPGPDTKVTAVEKKKFDFVIDLTEEALSNLNTDKFYFSNLVFTGGSVSTVKLPRKAALISKKTTPVAQTAAQVRIGSALSRSMHSKLSVLDRFKHLPPLPKPPPRLPQLVDKIRDTLPPQKPELKVNRVLRPMGIALSWNIAKINPKCAPVESYHVFLCCEKPSNKMIWKKIGEIKALPLPMACTLSQFFTSNEYYFTVQSKDIFGRYGPFCDIKSIPGISAPYLEKECLQ